MIIKANQRGSARELARHLMNTQDNEHVEVHKIEGLMAETIHDALSEIEAISRGTKCVQPLFSVSFNPPKGEVANVSDFEDVALRLAEKTNLQNQPYVMVFHEKEGRRHAHCVWSRIDAESMTAINLPYYKNRAMEVSKELYLEHGWELPQGHIDRELRNPLNFTLSQWQQAKRLNDNPKTIKATLQECWSVSDSKQSFIQALEQQGYYLAQGDRRGFVTVDWRGEIYSLTKWTGIKKKELQEKLGKPDTLKSVEATKAALDDTLTTRLKNHIHHVQNKYAHRLKPLYTKRDNMKERHDQEREELEAKQKQRRNEQLQEQISRFNTGLHGFWDRLTGKHAQIKKQNEVETYQSTLRDQKEKDQLIFRHIEQRRFLQDFIDKLNAKQERDTQEFKHALFSKLPENKTQKLEQQFTQENQPSLDHSPTLKM